MKTSSAKAKGRRLAKAVADMLLETFIGLESDDVVVTSSGATGEDLRLSPLARRKFPFSVECKNQEKINIWESIKQAESNAGAHTPLLIFSRNHSKVFCVIQFDAFLKMFKE